MVGVCAFPALVMMLASMPVVFAGTNTATSTYGPGSWTEETFYFKPQAERAQSAYTTIGFSSSTLTAKPSRSTIKYYLENHGSLYFSGHGGWCSGDGYSIWVRDENGDGSLQCTTEALRPSDINSITIPYQDLVVYDACYPCTGTNDLCEQTRNKGADCVIGWDSTITLSNSKCWSDKFYNCLDDETTTVFNCAVSAFSNCGISNSILALLGSCNYVLTR